MAFMKGSALDQASALPAVIMVICPDAARAAPPEIGAST